MSARIPLTVLMLALALVPAACDGLGLGPAGPQDSVANTAGDRRYEIQPGDTLFGIAERAYGDGLEWPRLVEANPWLAPPNVLKPGVVVYVPERYDDFEAPPAPPTGGAGPGARATNPGNSGEDGGASGIWKNIESQLSSSSLFGYTVHKLSFLLIFGALIHAVFQGFILWITTNVTFVKDATIKKAMHASFLTELLTLSTVALLAVVGLMMVYVGPASDGGANLLGGVEGFLQKDAGKGAVGICALLLYVLLNMRFVPQTFGIERSQAVTVVVVGVLLPHLACMYLAARSLKLIAA